MNLFCKLRLVLSAVLSLSSMRAQVTANQTMPPVVNMTRSGWDATLQNGNLTLAIPLAVVPGEVSVPVSFGMNGTYLVQAYSGTTEIKRPVVGAVHFGYIADPATYGAASLTGLTVLEDGYQIPDSDWSVFSTKSSTLGSLLTLPQAFGFSAVATTIAKVDSTATYLTFATDVSGLGTTYGPLAQGLAPSGFGAAGTSYKVVADKNKARIYAYATSVKTWLPVVWADRFGHYVKFQWNRATGMPPSMGPTSFSSVSITNQRSKGVKLRWAEYAASYSASTESDILRVDYLGINAPSMLVRGYPGNATSAPAGFSDALGIPPASQYSVIPSVIGSSCRPTSIQIGARANISEPGWSTGAGASTYTWIMPGAPDPAAADGTVSSDTQTWSFTYDANKAEIESYTDPRGLTTAFTYSNYPGSTRGVSRVDCWDLPVNYGRHTRTMRWTRTFPASGSATPLTVKVEGWWDTTQTGGASSSPDRYRLFTFPATASNDYKNGIYQIDALMDTAGKTWSTTTYAFNATGAGLNASLSAVQSVTVARDGAPTTTQSFGYADSTNLQQTQTNVTAMASGTSYMVSKTVNTYEARWDQLSGHQLTSVATTRYGPDGIAPLGTVTQINSYETAHLYLFDSYLDGGSTGKHGTSYRYDSEGRLNLQTVYHVEGTTWIASPNTQQVTYDSASGAVASTSVTDNTASPAVVISQSQGGFDSYGRATTQTDANGVTTTTVFDDRGRPRSVSRPGTPTITYEYPSEVMVRVIRNGQTTETTYDGFGVMRQVIAPTGISPTSGLAVTTKTTYSYDMYGRQTSVAELNPAGTGRSSSQSYDALDRLLTQTPITGGMTTYTYSVSGINSVVTATLSNGTSTVVASDPLGQVVTSVSGDGRQTTNTYDGFGNVVKQVLSPAAGSPYAGSSSQTRSWSFDGLGRASNKTAPETSTQILGAYNALNQPTVLREAMYPGSTTAFRMRTVTYDGFGRTRKVENASNASYSYTGNGDNITYTYSGPNLMSSNRTVGGVTVSQSYLYNGPAGMLSDETTTQPGLSSTISYGYDALGRLKTLTYPTLRVVGYGYDDLGRITSITNNNVALVSGIKFDDWGNRWQTLFDSGSQDQWDTNLTGTQLSNWSIGYAGSLTQGRGYTFDPATNILKTAGEWTLTHAKDGELTEADGFGIKTSHAPDLYGNAISHTTVTNGSTVPPSFNNFTFDPLPNNRIPGLEKNGALTGWNTNAMGEATQVGAATSSSTLLALGWDGLGVVKSVSWNAGNQSYLYAPSGMRVSLTDSVTPSFNRKYAYSSRGLLLGEYLNSTGTPVWKRDVVYLGNEAVAEIDANGVHELHNDHLGTPRLITKGAGNWASTDKGTIEATQVFGPYGEGPYSKGANDELTNPAGTYAPTTGYTGHLQTDASGLIYMRGRYYSPAWHVFVNSDQGADPNSANQRAYAGGSPFMGRDPSGMVHVEPGVVGRLSSGGATMRCMAPGGCDTTSLTGWQNEGSATVEVPGGDAGLWAYWQYMSKQWYSDDPPYPRNGSGSGGGRGGGDIIIDTPETLKKPDCPDKRDAKLWPSTPKGDDYVSTVHSYGPGAGLISAYTTDRYGNRYHTYGVYAGKSISPIGYSKSYGTLDILGGASEAQLKNFLGGWGYNGGVNAVLGFGFSYSTSSNATGIEGTIGVPGVGIQGGYTKTYAKSSDCP